MDKSDIRILIVEDDPSLGPAMAELFKRSGYEARLCASPDLALSISDSQEFHVLIIDCMLPKMNGVDLAQALLKKMDPLPTLFLMTGVFKDKSFIKDAIAKTGALTLLAKPFPLEKMVSLVEKELKRTVISPDLEPLPDLLTREECSSQDILHAFQAQASFHAFQIPLVLSLFARQGMTGELNIVSAERELSQITWIEGKIVDVRSSNKATQLGELLIEYGFAMPEDIEEVLAAERKGQPLGKQLIDAVAVSPHAIGMIREEQLAIRLSQLIRNTSIEISWLKKKVEMKDTFHALPSTRLKLLMSDWIVSKIPPEWLRSFYLQFLERVIGWRGKGSVKIEGAKVNLPILPTVIEKIQANKLSLQELLMELGDNELACLQAIHTLVLERKIFFGEKRRSHDDYLAKINRYQKLLASFRNKDLFQILGVSPKAKAAEIHRSYTDLAKRFHPDKLTADAPTELKELCHQIFASISHAHDTLTDEFKRQSYLDEMSRVNAMQVLELEPIFDQALNDLKSKKYGAASKKFEELLSKRAPMPDLLAYSYWAKMKAGHRLTEKQFFEIPPESRHSPIYLLAKGLFYKSQSQFQKALECFQNARLMDSHLSEAQREIVELIDENKVKNNGFLDRLLGLNSEPPKRKKSA